jgi:hypothetical protein
MRAEFLCSRAVFTNPKVDQQALDEWLNFLKHRPPASSDGHAHPCAAVQAGRSATAAGRGTGTGDKFRAATCFSVTLHTGWSKKRSARQSACRRQSTKRARQDAWMRREPKVRRVATMAESIRSARRNVGLTLRQLGAAAGLSASLRSQIENGRARPSPPRSIPWPRHLPCLWTKCPTLQQRRQ